MKITATVSSLVLASALAIAGCNAPPTEDVAGAKAPEGQAASAPAATSADESRRASKKKMDANTRRLNSAGARSNASGTPTARGGAAEIVTPPTKIKNVQPVYPAIARSARVEGSVVLAVHVDKDGRVSEATVIRSVPLLDQAALDAVKQWEYTPMRRGNVAVPTTMTVRVNFVRT